MGTSLLSALSLGEESTFTLAHASSPSSLMGGGGVLVGGIGELPERDADVLFFQVKE